MNIKIKKHSAIEFDIAKYDSKSSYILATFLVYEVGSISLNNYKKFMLDEGRLSITGNEISLDKEDNDIYLYNFLLGEDYDKGPCFKISIPDFLDLLDQWEEAISSNSDVITITRKNEKLIVDYR